MIGAVAFASQAAVAVGDPGRAVLTVSAAGPQPTVDAAAGAAAAVALPDGGAVLLAQEGERGLVVARIRADGALASGFGRGGVAHVALPEGATPSLPPRAIGRAFSVLQLLRAPDGRLLVIGMGTSRTPLELPQLVVVALTSSGMLDTTFGDHGVARPGLQASCGVCRPAALQPDGSIVLSGNLGSTSPPTGPDTPAFFEWYVARLTPRGDADASFGQGGFAAVGRPPGRNVGGYATSLLPDGRIVALGRDDTGPQLTRLLPSGAADPSFHAAAPVALPVPFAFSLAGHPDGFTDVRGPDRVLRVDPDGALDPAFGAGVEVGPSFLGGLLALPGRSVLAYDAAGFDARPASVGDLRLTKILADGRIEATPRLVAFGFGGGLARSRLAFGPPSPLPALAQTSFRASEVVLRPDRSVLAVGGVGVVRYTGEGSGVSTGRFAVGALTPDLAIDTRFGGPVHRERVRVRPTEERRRSVQRHGRLVLRVRYSGTAALAHIRIRARGRVIAEELEPLFAPGTSTVKVPLTRALPAGRPRVTITTTVRSLLADVVTQTVRVTLRR